MSSIKVTLGRAVAGAGVAGGAVLMAMAAGVDTESVSQLFQGDTGVDPLVDTVEKLQGADGALMEADAISALVKEGAVLSEDNFREAYTELTKAAEMKPENITQTVNTLYNGEMTEHQALIDTLQTANDKIMAQPTIIESTQDFAETPVGMAAGGAMLAGSSLGLLKSANKADARHDKAAVDSQLDNPAPGGFVEREQIRAMQGLMKARMAAASPEMAAQMGGGRQV